MKIKDKRDLHGQHLNSSLIEKKYISLSLALPSGGDAARLGAVQTRFT